MKIYKVKGNKEFEILDNEVFLPELVKIKISSVILTSNDICLYQGKINRTYPIVPGHMATAIVSEDRPEFDLKRGARVILNPYILSSAGGEGISDVKLYGLDADGFLRDFAALPADNIIPFPEAVKEEEALFTEAVAVALSTINAMKINKGEYVAIVGGSIVANLIGQLLLYYQAIPIYVSSEPRYLEIAKKCGIYHLIDESRDDPYQRVMEITGGRMAEHSVIYAKAGVSPHFLFSLAGRGGDCIIVSLSSSIPRMETDISLVSKKNLSVGGVSCGVDEINAAVNIIAQKQLDFSHFIDKSVAFDEVIPLFEELSEHPLRYICPVVRV
ncbi:MAG: medium chain dehydrogenase/reductase family protein [Clostridia bacterium]